MNLQRTKHVMNGGRFQRNWFENLMNVGSGNFGILRGENFKNQIFSEGGQGRPSDGSLFRESQAIFHLFRLP